MKRLVLALGLGIGVVGVGVGGVMVGVVDEEPQYTRLTLKGGKTLRAYVVEQDGQRYRLHISVQGGSSSGWYELDAFEDESQVRLLESLVRGDLEAQLGVAEFAAEKGLAEMARRELRKCSHLAEGEDEDTLVALAPRAVALTIELVHAYAKMGRLAEARHGVDRILVRQADALTEDQKHALMAAVEEAGAEQEASKEAERRAEAEEKADRERDRRLEPVQKDLEKAQELRRQGLLASSNYTKASRLLERAIKEFDSVLERTEKLGATLGQDPVAVKELGRIETRATEQLVDTLLANASLDLARGRFSDAMGAVNRILADDPDHRRALAMRNRIEVAENDWGW